MKMTMTDATQIRQNMLDAISNKYENELSFIMGEIQEAAANMQDGVCIHNTDVPHNKFIHKVLESLGYAINSNWHDGQPGWMIFWD